MPKKIDMTKADDIKVTERIPSGDQRLTKFLTLIIITQLYN